MKSSVNYTQSVMLKPQLFYYHETKFQITYTKTYPEDFPNMFHHQLQRPEVGLPISSLYMSRVNKMFKNKSEL